MDDLHHFIVEAHAGESFPSENGKQLYKYEMHEQRKMPTRWLTLQELQDEFEIVEIKLDPIEEICKDNDNNLIAITFVCRSRV